MNTQIYVYPETGAEFLVVSSAFNDGAGAILCRLGHRRKHVRIIRVPPLFIEGNEAGEPTVFARSTFRPNGLSLSASEAVRALHSALVKFIKTRHVGVDGEPNWHCGYYRDRITALILEAIDHVAAASDDLPLMLRLLHRTKLTSHLERTSQAVLLEVERRFVNHKARLIQRHWRHANADPSHELCRRRLLREFKEFSRKEITAQ